MYRCDSKFYVDPILDMYKLETNYGVVLLSGSAYQIYIISVSGNYYEIICLESDTHQLQKKHRKGGQSQLRFARTAEEKRASYVRMLAELIAENYLRNNNTEYVIEGLIIAGPTNIKREVMKEDIFKQYFTSRIIDVIDTEEINDTTIGTIVKLHKSKFNPVLAIEDIEEIFSMVDQADDRLIFGVTDITACIANNSIQKLLLHKDNKQFEHINSKICVIKTDDPRIQAFGNMIGVKYFTDKTTQFDNDLDDAEQNTIDDFGL